MKTSEELKNALVKDVYGAFGLGPCSFVDEQLSERFKATLEEYGCVFEKTPATHDVYAPLTPSKQLCTKCGGSGEIQRNVGVAIVGGWDYFFTYEPCPICKGKGWVWE